MISGNRTMWLPDGLRLFPAECRKSHVETACGYLPCPEFEHLLRTARHAVFPIVPLRSGLAAASCFRDRVISARASHGPVGNCLHVYSSLDYAMMRLFLDPEGYAGFALNGSEIVSVFSHQRRRPNRASRNLIGLAVQLGGTRLDAFDTVLPTLYGQCGFTKVARLAWSDDHAPEGWDYQSVIQYNGGRPDVVFMVHGVSQGRERLVLTYEEGLRAQFLALDGLSGMEVRG